MQSINGTDKDRVRLMAESLDCLLEEDFQLLAGATANTIEAWRKRGQGPAYILLGNRFLYPRKAVAKHLESITRERTVTVKGLL
jgi:glutaredoxin 2